MRIFEFSGAGLTKAVGFITDAISHSLKQNFTVMEIKIDDKTVSQLGSPTGSETAADKAILHFLRMETNYKTLRDFAIANDLVLVMKDQNATADAVRPIAGLTALDVNTITWQAGVRTRIAFNGTPNLSNVKVGDWAKVITSANVVNNGRFEIVAVSDASDYIDIINPAKTSATGNDAANSAAVVEIKSIAL